MQSFLEAYLKDHETAWAETTLKTEASRLRALGRLLGQEPKVVFEELMRTHKPYTVKSVFMRLASMEAWCAVRGHKPKGFREFVRKHRNRFKHVYQKEELNITFEEAVQRIETLEDPYKEMAKALLKTGLRISEAYKVENGQVQGKGGKVRTVYGDIKATAPKSTFTRKLKAVGLKPHTLRKLCATRLAEKGATPADLCKIFGWSSIATAYQYLQGKDDKRLQELMGE